VEHSLRRGFKLALDDEACMLRGPVWHGILR
jgi:hypothetical protein